MPEIVRTGAIREFSPAELLADRTVHVVGLAAGMAGAVALTLVAAIARPWAALATVVAYSVGLLAMLGFSAAYNLSRQGRRRDVLHRLDLAAIFVMIAGTYTPFTILGLDGGWAVGMTALVWTIAALGIAMKLLTPPGRFPVASVLIYLAFGWIGLIAAVPIARSVSPVILALVVVGGLLYTVGTLFHAWERLPFQTAIWHGFVLSAAAVHFAAVFGLILA